MGASLSLRPRTGLRRRKAYEYLRRSHVQMVEVRLPAMISFVISLSSIFVLWIVGEGLDTSLVNVWSAYATPQFASATYAGRVHSLLMPYIASPLQFVAIALATGGLAVSLLVLLRWEFMWLAGIMLTVGSALWIFDIYTIPDVVAKQLCSLSGSSAGQITCSTPVLQTGVGPILMLLGGIIMLAGYVLGRKGRIAQPLDAEMPYEEGHRNVATT